MSGTKDVEVQKKVTGTLTRAKQVKYLMDVNGKLKRAMEQQGAELQLLGQMIRKLLLALDWTEIGLTMFEIQNMDGMATVGLRREEDGTFVCALAEVPGTVPAPAPAEEEEGPAN